MKRLTATLVAELIITVLCVAWAAQGESATWFAFCAACGGFCVGVDACRIIKRRGDEREFREGVARVAAILRQCADARRAP